MTTMLQTLSEIVQTFSEARNRWQSRPNSPTKALSTRVQAHQDSVLTTKTVKLDFPRFKGENPLGWVYKAQKIFHLYNSSTA